MSTFVEVNINTADMQHSQQTIQQVDRAIDKIIGKFPLSEDSVAFTDIHLKVIQDSGEILV